MCSKDFHNCGVFIKRYHTKHVYVSFVLMQEHKILNIIDEIFTIKLT